MNDDNNPVVSIVVPTCNRAKLLKRMVNSVLDQSYDKWELLAIDDKSQDETEDMMLKLNIQDSRIKYFRIQTDDSPGISKYLNFGINAASGKYISRLDDDDYWIDKNTLESQVEFLDSHPRHVIVGGGVIIINDKSEELYRYYKKEKDYDIRKNALIANPFAHNTVMFRKKEVLEIGGYHNLSFAEDWDLWLRLGKIGKFYNFQKHFTCYLVAGQNLSFRKQKQQSRLLFKIINSYKNDYPGYMKGLALNLLQYTYSFLPDFIKKRMHSFMIFIKRNYF